MLTHVIVLGGAGGCSMTGRRGGHENEGGTWFRQTRFQQTRCHNMRFGKLGFSKLGVIICDKAGSLALVLCRCLLG